jgi:hypothetical protein
VPSFESAAADDAPSLMTVHGTIPFGMYVAAIVRPLTAVSRHPECL